MRKLIKPKSLVPTFKWTCVFSVFSQRNVPLKKSKVKIYLSILAQPSLHKIWANILEKLLNSIKVYEACFANIRSQSAVPGLTQSAISSHSKWYFGIEILSVWIHSSKYHSFSFRRFSLFGMCIYVFCGRLCLFFFCEKVILETSESTPESLISTICSHHSHWNGKQPSAMFGVKFSAIIQRSCHSFVTV